MVSISCIPDSSVLEARLGAERGHSASLQATQTRGHDQFQRWGNDGGDGMWREGGREGGRDAGRERGSDAGKEGEPGEREEGMKGGV